MVFGPTYIISFKPLEPHHQHARRLLGSCGNSCLNMHLMVEVRPNNSEIPDNFSALKTMLQASTTADDPQQ